MAIASRTWAILQSSALAACALAGGITCCEAAAQVAGDMVEQKPALGPDVRGLATKATGPVEVDGKLDEFARAFCTTSGYFTDMVDGRDGALNRAAQVFYMWDEQALYVGVRTLDQKQANHASDAALLDGDAAALLIDTRPTDAARGQWGPGAAQICFAALRGDQLGPRWALTPEMPTAIAGNGIETAATRTNVAVELEIKIPWSNFPEFQPAVDATLGLDVEICHSDGEERVDQAFVYTNQLAWRHPAALPRIQLVERFQREHWEQCGPALAPVRSDLPWASNLEARVLCYAALPPNFVDDVGKVVFRLVDTAGRTLHEFDGEREAIESTGRFLRIKSQWPLSAAVPGRQSLMAIVYDRDGKELTRVTLERISHGPRQGF